MRHLLWCCDDTSIGVARTDVSHDEIKEHLDDICTAFGLAEQQTTKAVSLQSKLGLGVPDLVNHLCTTGRARLSTPEQREAILNLAAGDFDEEDDDQGEGGVPGSLKTPTVREYVCNAQGGKKGCMQQLFVRMEPSLFRIATATTTPSL